MVELTSVNLDPRRSLLMVVDMQNEFCKEGGLRYSPKSAALIPAIRGLVGRARKNGIPIMWAHSVRNQREAAVTVFGYDHYAQEGAWNSEIVVELSARQEDVHIYKYSHNVWWQTDLEEKLAELVKEPTDTNVVVTGISSTGCAYRAIMGFHLRDYWTYVPLDCTNEDEWAKEQFALKEYCNVFPTRSDLIGFGPPVPGTSPS